MCLTLMWDQSWLGLQPQSLNFTIICCPGVTQISRWHPKAWSAGAAGMLLGHIHMHIHCIWRLSNTLHVSDIDVGSILIGLQPQSLHFTIICCPGVTQISRWHPKAWSAGAAGMLLGHIHMHIHCIWRLSNTLHVSDIDVGSILIGSTASITALHHH
jgi:hypothetical protein